MIIHKINVYNRDIIVVENDDGTFNKPDILSEFEGIGSALKPALEPITVARKPLDEKTVAENCLKWGVGGINIDGCRVGTEESLARPYGGENEIYGEYKMQRGTITGEGLSGRFPANLIHDNSDEVVSLFPDVKGATSRTSTKPSNPTSYSAGGQANTPIYKDSTTSASRFFYCAKASKSERNKGCEELEEKRKYTRLGDDNAIFSPNSQEPTKNFHPTVKPIALMEYLVKLVSREGALVLDPFAGSGSTLLACKNLGRGYVGIEMDEEYVKIINARLGNTL